MNEFSEKMAAHKAKLWTLEKARDHMGFTTEMVNYVSLCVEHSKGLDVCVQFLCDRVYQKHWPYIKTDPNFLDVALKAKNLLIALMEKHPNLFVSNYRAIAISMCKDATPPVPSEEPEPTSATRQLSEIEEAIEEKVEEVRKPKKQKPDSISPPGMQLYQDPDAAALSSGRLSLESSSKSNSNSRLSK